MKLDDHFRTLLTDTVNLPPGKLTELEDRVDAIYRALESSDIGDRIIDKDPQGSWAQKTIIRPRPGHEFDGDVMIRMEHEPDWNNDPKQYINAVYNVLKDHGTYGKLDPTRKARCVRLTYANDFHVDLVPIVDHSWRGLSIIDRDTNSFEKSDPAGFTDWMLAKDGTAEGNLRRVIRLMKYVRDHRSNFSGTKSIILTTLLGERVTTWKKVVEPGYYTSTATALKHLTADLDEWLQERPTKPSIPVPGNTGLTYDHRWTEESYQHFRDRMHTLAADIASAHDEGDKDTSVELWQDIFGTGFRPPATTASSAAGRFGVTSTATVSRSGRGG